MGMKMKMEMGMGIDASPKWIMRILPTELVLLVDYGKMEMGMAKVMEMEMEMEMAMRVGIAMVEMDLEMAIGDEVENNLTMTISINSTICISNAKTLTSTTNTIMTGPIFTAIWTWKTVFSIIPGGTLFAKFTETIHTANTFAGPREAIITARQNELLR